MIELNQKHYNFLYSYLSNETWVFFSYDDGWFTYIAHPFFLNFSEPPFNYKNLTLTIYPNDEVELHLHEYLTTLYKKSKRIRFSPSINWKKRKPPFHLKNYWSKDYKDLFFNKLKPNLRYRLINLIDSYIARDSRKFFLGIENKNNRPITLEEFAKLISFYPDDLMFKAMNIGKTSINHLYQIVGELDLTIDYTLYTDEHQAV